MKLKQEKGSVTLFVLVSLLFFVLFLSGMYLLSSSREQTGYVETAKVKEIYESDVSRADDVYETLVEGRDILDELKIGDTVMYTPPEATYTWQAEYCSSANADGKENTTDAILKNTDSSYKITEWKVFNINGDTRQIELISANPTEETVYLGGAQGYNNCVKLLNEACSNLYGNKEIEIEGRSINIEDIENKMTGEALTDAHSFVHQSSQSNTKYGEQVQNKFTIFKYYPSIYASEKNSTIDEHFNPTGIGRSEQGSLIKRTDNSATNGLLQATTSIQPYQTYWQRSSAILKTSFKSTEEYNLIIPEGTNTNYYIASRTINTRALAGECDFNIFSVRQGGIEGKPFIYRQTGITTYYAGSAECNIRPIITLNVNLIKGSSEEGWSIK